MNAIIQPETETKALTALEKARSFDLVTVQDREYVETEVKLLKALEDEIDGVFKPLAQAADKSHKDIVAAWKEKKVPVNEARAILKGKAIQWDTEQERIRREEEARLREIARKQAEDEALAVAMLAEQEGQADVAEAILAAPVDVAPVSVPKAGPAPSRLTAGRSVWSAEVFDFPALVKAASTNSQYLALLTPNDTALNGMARSLKQSMQVPGVRAVERRV